jgi:hypothetical protein
MCEQVLKILWIDVIRIIFAIVQARFNFNLLCDLHTLLGLSCLLISLLEVVNALIRFTLVWGGFLYMWLCSNYIDLLNIFFNDVLGSNKQLLTLKSPRCFLMQWKTIIPQITHDWVINLNNILNTFFSCD